MDPYMNPACPPVKHLKRVHMRIKLFPLAAPVGANLLLPDHTPTFRCLGPAYTVTHKGQCSINVPLVESRIGLSDKALCLRHSFLRADAHSAMHMVNPEKRASRQFGLNVRFLTFGVMTPIRTIDNYFHFI